MTRLSVRKRLGDIALPIAFATGLSPLYLFIIKEPSALGHDGIVYTTAARAWLAGADPWQAQAAGVYFAAPPTALLPYVLLVGLPDRLVGFVAVVVCGCAAAWALHRLQLPGWWIAFPPLGSAVLLGNLDALVLAALVSGRGIAATAPLMKAYSAAALLAERRWWSLLGAVGLLALTIPFLPWGTFVARYGQLSTEVVNQWVRNPLWDFPILLVMTLTALLGLGVRRGLWLAAPVLAPVTQAHYAAMAVPAVTPAMAVAWALPTPWAPAAAVAVGVVERSIRRARGSDLPPVASAASAPTGHDGLETLLQRPR